jgi:ferredoxin-NADP reductase
VYNGKGPFSISSKDYTFNKVNLILSGSGITPGYSPIVRALLSLDEEMQIHVIDANRSEKDILLKEEVDSFERKSDGRPRSRMYRAIQARTEKAGRVMPKLVSLGRVSFHQVIVHVQSCVTPADDIEGSATRAEGLGVHRR